MSDETSRVDDATSDDAPSQSSPEDKVPPVNDTRSNNNRDGDDASDGVQAVLDALREESQKNLDGWQRSRAEFTNYKKRVQKELSEANERAAIDTLSKVLPIIDDFERAIQNIPEDIAEHPWVTGTALIMKKFDRLLEEHEVSVIDPVGEPFDPHHHEAIGMDEGSDYESGIVTTTLQKGFVCGGRVLRPALVRVAH